MLSGKSKLSLNYNINFLQVMLVEKKDSKKVFALKSLRKQDIIGKDQVAHTRTEREVLEKVINIYSFSNKIITE